MGSVSKREGKSQRKDKVKGKVKEIFFNDPIFGFSFL